MINKAFYLVTLVVRGGVEPPTFRFSGVGETTAANGTGRSGVTWRAPKQLVDGDVAVRAAVTGEGFYSM